MVVARREINGVVTMSVRYYLSSLATLRAEIGQSGARALEY